MKKNFALCFLAAMLALVVCAFVACNSDATVTLSFETDGGSTVTPMTFAVGTQDVQLPTPEKAGYDFGGWYVDQACLTSFDLSSATKSVTLYAKWTAKPTFTVSFASCGGTEYGDVLSDGQAIALPTPQKEGFIFDGWYENADFSGEKLSGNYVPSKDVTLYAKWNDLYPVKAILDLDGGYLEETVLAYKGEPLTLPVPTKYGYKFLGWFTDDGFAEAAVEPIELTQSATFYAKWEQVTYVYLYYGQFTDHQRLEYAPGSTVDTTEFFTPEDKVVDGFSYKFLGWHFEDPSVNYSVGQAVPSTFEVGEDHVVIIATYEPMKNVAQDQEGNVITTGNVAYAKFDQEGNGVLESQITFNKGAAGGIGLAFRMTLSGADYAFQDEGTTYMSVVFVPASGAVQIGQVVNGLFEHYVSLQQLSTLPVSWQNKFNSESTITATLAVVVKDSGFDIYIDNVLAKSVTDADARTGRTNNLAWSDFVGTGWGIRSSSAGAIVNTLDRFDVPNQINFRSNGGTVCQPLSYVYGAPDLPSPEKQDVVFAGWYYDEELTQKVNPLTFTARQSVTLYAAWTTEFSRVYFEPNGGTACASVNYVDGALPLPETKRANFVFEGWCYDEQLTQLVDPNAPQITTDSTLYAKWRKVTHTKYTEENGVITTTGSVAYPFIISDSPYGEISANLTAVKNGGGSVNLAFRMAMYGDNAYESGCVYLAVGILPNNGGMQFSQVDGKFAHYISALSLTKLPMAWQTKWNALANGDSFTFALRIVSKPDCFEVYLDGEHVITVSDSNKAAASQPLAYFSGTGFGIRSSQTGVVYNDFTFTPYFQVTYNDGRNDLETQLCAQGTILDKTLPDGQVLGNETDGFYVDRFSGWYTAADGGEKVESASFSGTIYAHYEQVPFYQVKFDADNGTAPVLRYYEGGATATLEDAPSKNGHIDEQSGTLIGYVFNGWYEGNEQAADGFVVERNIVLVAKYDESTAYVISYETNLVGVSKENDVVSANAVFTPAALEAEGMRFVGWFDDEQLTVEHQSGAVTSSFKLYAKWVETITLTFTLEGETVGTQTIDKGATATLPQASAKASQTLENGNVISYEFGGWYVGETQVEATTTFDADAQIVGKYVGTETRNGYVVVKNADGNDGYVISGTCAQQGFTAPGLSAKVGEFSYDLTFNKSSGSFNFRTMFYVDDAGIVKYTGAGDQGGIWINIHLQTGDVILGRKIKGNTNNTWVMSLSSLAQCSFKQKFSAAAVGEEMTLNFKVVFAPGAMKYYVDDCLVCVYGADYTGETLYGKNCTSDNSASPTGVAAFVDWMNEPSGTQVGFQIWQNASVVGDHVVISNVQLKQASAVTVDCGNGETLKNVYVNGSKLNLPADPVKGPQVVDEDTAVYYEFDGWYVGDDKIAEDYVVSGDTIVVAKYKESTVTVYKINYVTNSDDVQKDATTVAPGEIPEIDDLADLANMRFGGWYEDKDLTVAYTPKEVASSFTLYAKWIETVTSTVNGVTIRSDKDGSNTVYDFGGKYTTTSGGIVMPSATAEQGSFNFDLSFDASVGNVIRMAFYGFSDSLATFQPSAYVNQGTAFVSINQNTGTIQWGYYAAGIKQAGQIAGTVSSMGTAGNPVRTKWEAAKASTTDNRVSFAVSIVFDHKGAKLYLDGCLMTTVGEVDSTGETIYGTAFTTANGAAGYAGMMTYMADPAGNEVGWIVWQDYTGHDIVVSNAVCTQTAAEQTSDSNEATQQAILPAKEDE